jgi:hypothetical protein
VVHSDGGSRSRNNVLALVSLPEIQSTAEPGTGRMIRKPTLNKNKKKHREPPHMNREKNNITPFVYQKVIVLNVYFAVKHHIVQK